MGVDETLGGITQYVTIGLNHEVESTILNLNSTIARMKATGMSDVAIESAIMTDLVNGEQIFGGFRAGLRNLLKNGIELAALHALVTGLTERGIEKFKWVTAGGRICPDCEVRHNQVQTLDVWESVGLPKSGFSVCNEHCRCVLVPEGYIVEKPLKI